MGVGAVKKLFELASGGVLKKARTFKEDVKAIESGDSFASIVNLNEGKLSDRYESGALNDYLAKKGFYVDDDKFGNVIFGKDKQSVEYLKNAKNPYEYGKAYGYSDADIAKFYETRRGGNEMWESEFLKDKNSSRREVMGAGAIVKAGVESFENAVKAYKKNKSTIKGAERKAFPGVYDDPAKIAKIASERSAPETPAMKELFGVDRRELYEMSQERGLGGESVFQRGAKARGAKAAEPIMQPANTQRVTDILTEGGKYPEIYEGMDAWYNLDPLYNQFVKLFGKEEGARRFKQYNAFSGMSSPMSDVLTETSRGTAANWLHNQGRFEDFVKYGGKRGDQPGETPRPPGMGDYPGHMAHTTAQTPAMRKYIANAGAVDMKSPKVPVYIQAALPEELGGSWRVPVGDAHWSRAVGLPDTRNLKKVDGVYKVNDASVSPSELGSLTPWFSSIADDVGILPVPAQARLWGTASHATGVESPIGASKLELVANKIYDQAQKRGVDPKLFRDYVLAGGDVKKLGLSSAALASLVGIPAHASENALTEAGGMLSGTDLSLARRDDRPFFKTMGEYGLSALRGIPLGIIDTAYAIEDAAKYLGMMPDNSAYVPSSVSEQTRENMRNLIPDYEAKYATDEDKSIFEFLGGLFSPI